MCKDMVVVDCLLVLFNITGVVSLEVEFDNGETMGLVSGKSKETLLERGGAYHFLAILWEQLPTTCCLVYTWFLLPG